MAPEKFIHVNHPVNRSIYITVFLFLLTWTAAPVNLYAQMQRPNIIFILSDDIGYEIPTCNGGLSYSTPRLDSMAQHGMRFTQFHAPLCSPSRFMILTGKYNFRNYTKWGEMDHSQKTLGNLFKDAGYKTAYYGKWQLAGGDPSIHIFGFDQYSIWNPLDPSTKELRYKNPHIYENGKFVSDKLTKNKYGDDIFTDSLMNFIDSNKANPFFIYYSMCIGHAPFCPTPDDSVFGIWNTGRPSDTAFFPSMVKYMDKKVGMIIDKVNSLGLANNTVIIFASDNGTGGGVYSEYGDTTLSGGKNTTTELGTHVPLLISWAGKITGGTVNNDLIDCPDILPTFADIAGITVSSDYGILDGVDFAPRLTGDAGTPRDWIFCHFDPQSGNHDTLKRWVQNKTYKLYDTTFSHEFTFYNMVADLGEEHPIPDAALTPEELIIKQQFLDILANIEKGLPAVSSGSVSNTAFSSADIYATIAADGGHSVTERGIVWDTVSNPSLVNNYITKDTGTGSFTVSLKKLKINTTYYVKPFAVNIAGTAYGKEISFTTLSLPVPVATNATGVTDTGFTANWNASAGAKKYGLDVSLYASFSVLSPVQLLQGFDNGTSTQDGWTLSNGISIYTNAGNFGNASPSLQLKATGQQIVSPVLDGNPANELSFWIKGVGTNAVSSLLVEGYDGSNWVTIENIFNLPATGTVKTYNGSSVPVLANNFTRFRFTYTKAGGNLAFDDVTIKYHANTPSFVPGYNNLTVGSASKPVTGLTAATAYYYRIRALDKTGNLSGNSNVITATTTGTGKYIAERPGADSSKNNSQRPAKESGLHASIFPNPGKKDFTLVCKSNNKEPVNIKVWDMFGKMVYQTKYDAGGHCKFGENFAAGIYIAEVMQGENIITLRLVKGSAE